MEKEPGNQRRLTSIRAALTTIVPVANAIGLAPYLLFVDRLDWLLAVVPVSALFAFLAVRKLTTKAASHPLPAEWLMGAWSAVSLPSGGSLVGMALYGLFFGGAKLFDLAAESAGFAPNVHPETWGFWASIWFVGLVAISASGQRPRMLFHQLYPRETWARSAFFSQLARSRLFAVMAVGGALLAGAMFWLLDPDGVALPILLSLLLTYTSFPFARLGEKATDKSAAHVVTAVVTLLEQAGYRVVRAPRTGKPEIDPLLQSVDLLAKGHDRAFAIDIRMAEAGTPVEWNVATAVHTAAALLSDEIAAEKDAPGTVQPVLVQVGGRLEKSIEAFAQREGVLLVHFASAAEATGDGRELARRLQEAGIVLPSTQPLPAKA